MKLAFEPIWPWPLVLLACLAMVGVVAIGYPRRVKHLPKLWQRVLLTIRLLLVLLIGLWLARPLVTRETDNSDGGVLYVINDSSRSMNTPDAVGGKTRREAALQLLEDAKPLLDELSEVVEIRYRDLADDLLPIDAAAMPESVEGNMTAIGYNLNALMQESKSEKVAAILFWSDGKQAASGKRDVDAIQEARLIGRKHRPIYTVPFGSSEVAATTLDVAVSELDVPRDAFIGNVIPIKVRVRTYGAQGQDLRVRLYAEDRAGVPAGTAGVMEAVRGNIDNVTVFAHAPQSPAEDMIVNLQFVPESKHLGEIKLRVEAEALNGEVRLTNNRVETIIRVTSEGIRVAYFDSLRAEFKWLKRVNRNNRIQLDAKWLKGGDDLTKNTFDETWFEPGKFDAFIIGDVPAAAFGEERLQKLYECCERGAGLMMIGGSRSFGPGGYHNTPLARLLPIEMSEADQQLTSDIPMIPRRIAIADPILQIASPDQNAAMWSVLPPLRGASVLRVKEASGAQVLAESPNKMPLLIKQSTGRSRVLAFAGDTTWQWAMHEEDWAVEAHQRFWRQVIMWVTKMDQDSESPLWVHVEPRNMNPGRVAEITFGQRDENNMPLSGVDYKVNVKTPEEETEPVTPRTVEQQGEAEYQNTMVPGDYWVNVSSGGQAGQGELYASTRFLVNARDPELDNPAADPGLLREIAHVSGGDSLTAETMIERLQEWVDNGLPSLKSRRSERTNLWDNWFSLLLFVLLIALEWFLRKKRGLV